MTDPSKLKEAVDRAVAGEIRSALKPHEIEIVSTLLDAARIVLAAQAAPGEEHWLVWSNEHGSFWRGNARGYTRHIEQAGRYTEAEADKHCLSRSRRADVVAPEIKIPAPEALLAASLHRPVEARVTEEAVRIASATLERELERCGIITTVTPMIARLVLEAASLPSPQVTRGEVARAIDPTVWGVSDADGKLHPATGESLEAANRILSLFYGRAKP